MSLSHIRDRTEAVIEQLLDCQLLRTLPTSEPSAARITIATITPLKKPEPQPCNDDEAKVKTLIACNPPIGIQKLLERGEDDLPIGHSIWHSGMFELHVIFASFGCAQFALGLPG